MFETITINGIGQIPTYNLLVGIGILSGLLYFEHKNKEIDDNVKFKIYNILFLSFFFGFIGSRIFDLIFFSKEFTINNFLSGSSTFMGGLLFAFAFSIISVKLFGLGYLYTLNILIPFVLVSHFFGRIGCFLAGCCFGKESSSSLIGVKYPINSLPYSHYKYVVNTHPTQLYEALCLAIIFVIVKNKENKVASYLLLYGLCRFFIEFYRNDQRGDFFFGVLSPSQVMSILFFAIGTLLYLKNRIQSHTL